MFRIISTGCTIRHMGRFGRAGPCIRKGRGDPYPHLKLVDSGKRTSDFEEMIRHIINVNQKENKS